jgi:hypothetical protein
MLALRTKAMIVETSRAAGHPNDSGHPSPPSKACLPRHRVTKFQEDGDVERVMHVQSVCLTLYFFGDR